MFTTPAEASCARSAKLPGTPWGAIASDRPFSRQKRSPVDSSGAASSLLPNRSMARAALSRHAMRTSSAPEATSMATAAADTRSAVPNRLAFMTDSGC
jgi:hypothetical protein